jgi:ATP-binding cassette, subfamily B, bacterial
MINFPYYKQPDATDCGPTCLRIISKHFGRHYNLETLRELTWKNRTGVSLLSISDAAEKLGFRTQGVRLSIDKLKEVPLPAILHWNQEHFVVLYKIGKAELSNSPRCR